MGQNLIVKEEYQISDEWNYLVEDCKAIMSQRIKNSRMEVILAYAEIGNRIVEDPLYNKYGKGNQKFLFSLCSEIGISGSSGYFALQFYERFIKKYMLPSGDVYNALYLSMQENFLDEGDNISWFKIVNKYLPRPKEKPTQDQWIRYYDVWNFANKLGGFGEDRPAQCPPQVILNFIYYFTRENDLIIDPMAGGGAMTDCANYLKRKSLCYDNVPFPLKLVKFNDIRKGYPREAEGCDAVFIDPPYGSQKGEVFKKSSVTHRNKGKI